jgi:LPS-assembly protein
VIQGSRYVGADRVTYDRGSSDLVARGNAIVGNPGMRLVADEAKMNLESDKGSLTNVEYRLFGKINARGTADRARLVQPELTQYENIVYTTCRPGQNAWSLDAEKMELDQSEGWGVARNAKLRVGSIPVLYTPYLSFPIDDRRKSGVLVPTVGSSEDNGIDVTVPYYWNIAPNMDATFFPRYMGKRGGMLGTEFRYLSKRQSSEVYGEIVPHDRAFEDGATRWAFRVEHKARIAPRWSTNVNFNQVSDDEYLEDFGNNLDLTSIRNIQRRGDLVYTGNGWSLLTRLLDYQTVDPTISPTSRPYARLPQLLLAASPMRLDSGIQLGVDGEYDYFRHEAKVQGHRASLQPYATWPLRKSYGHLIPKLNLYLSAYGLQDQDPDQQNNPSYAIPSFSLDGELVFERTVQWFDHESLQTLEPRIYYLYTPFVDQEDIPVFDSSELTFSYSSLFRGNRFTGRDRIGDANQLTLGLSTRTLAQESGRELLRASVGQILYFRDRDVQISGPPEDASSSSIAGELSARLLDNLTGRATFEWDPNEEQDRSRKRVLELHYEDRDDRLLNAAYRFDLGKSEATRYEDTDLSFSMPVGSNLKLVGRWYYSLLNSETIEAFAGVEYGQCCWHLRLLGQHLKNKPDSAGSNTIMVQMELAGLGSIGQQVEKFLERGIYGYHAD